MCDVPLGLSDDEILVRALRVPQHIDERKGKIRAAAFRPKGGTDDLSVMRKTHMGESACKVKAKEILRDAYRGFAALEVGEVIGTGATAHDSRGQYCGHAHISQGIPAPIVGETIDPALQEQYKKLSDLARLHLDHEPNSESWRNGPIV